MLALIIAVAIYHLRNIPEEPPGRLVTMIQIVDFNMKEPDGRIPALLQAGAAESVAIGDSVIASDGEGLECRAVVSEISSDGRYAMLETKGRLREGSHLRPSSVSDLHASPSRRDS